MSKKVAVIAIGGNSLIKDKAHQSVQEQYFAADETAKHIVEMIKEGWDVVIGHGNGPQVGFLLQKAEIAEKVANLAMAPLEVCGAQSQGQIGYQLVQCLQNEMKKAGVNKAAACVIEQTVVNKNDPAFQNPSKPIGGFMTEEEARIKERELGWNVVEDAGRGWRRVVPSPLPCRYHCCFHRRRRYSRDRTGRWYIGRDRGSYRQGLRQFASGTEAERGCTGDLNRSRKGGY